MLCCSTWLSLSTSFYLSTPSLPLRPCYLFFSFPLSLNIFYLIHFFLSFTFLPFPLPSLPFLYLPFPPLCLFTFPSPLTFPLFFHFSFLSSSLPPIPLASVSFSLFLYIPFTSYFPLLLSIFFPLYARLPFPSIAFFLHSPTSPPYSLSTLVIFHPLTSLSIGTFSHFTFFSSPPILPFPYVPPLPFFISFLSFLPIVLIYPLLFLFALLYPVSFPSIYIFFSLSTTLKSVSCVFSFQSSRKVIGFPLC